MIDAGIRSFLTFWLGGGGGLFIPPPLTPAPGVPTLAVKTEEILARMLLRLPPSLWDIEPASDTLQRDLFRALAAQIAVWLEQREIARTMTLIRDAQGVDLDVLLQDYGLKRYLQRPDAYASQVGRNILWTPKGTLYSVAQLADLLFDLPHVTLRTGRGHQHVFVAATQAVTTPYSYWGLVSQEGLWYAVTVHATVPTISQAPPPGLDLAPGPHTLTWFTVLDDVEAPWYVTIAADTLQVAQALPAGYGTTEPFSTLDGQGQRWGLAVRAADHALVSVLEVEDTAFGHWVLRSSEGATVALWIEAEVPTLATTPPGGSTDQTPGGSPLDWCVALDHTGAPWYVHVEHDTLVATTTPPGGSGSGETVDLFDAAGQPWRLTMHQGEEAVVTTALRDATADLVVLTPTTAFQMFALQDATGVPWWVSIVAGTVLAQAAPPLGAINVTPPGGPYRWLRAYDAEGGRWYAAPSTVGALVVTSATPGGLGTATPQRLGDTNGVLWHLGVGAGPTLVASNAPPLDYAGMATAVCLRDATGGRWFWRVHGQVLEWSAVLWPNTVDQSPWGDLGWLQVPNTESALRYVYPTPQGDPIVTAGPPPAAPWGWPASVALRDLAGTWWHLDVLLDDRLGVFPDPPVAALRQPEAIPLQEALEAFAHVQAAGSTLTLLVT